MEGERMRDRLLPALIMLIAGAVTCIIDIYHKADLLSSLKRLLFVLIIFYVLGLIAKAIIIKVLEPKLSKKYEDTEAVAEDNIEDISKDNTKENTEAIDKNKSEANDDSKA
jgi:p-aminobenzoyl-glutamate transporter AbgT